MGTTCMGFSRSVVVPWVSDFIHARHHRLLSTLHKLLLPCFFTPSLELYYHCGNVKYGPSTTGACRRSFGKVAGSMGLGSPDK